MLRKSVHSGVTLIELLVGLAIVAILLALGLPSLSGYLANSKIRAAASNFSADMQFARAESIQRNGGVGLLLTSDAPTGANAATAAPSAAGPNWMVRWFNPNAASAVPPTPTYTMLTGKAAAEGATQVVLAGPVSSVNFSSLGATDQAAMVSFDFSNPSSGACVAVGGPMRCLRVQVTAGGQVRVCDPAVTTAGDSRTCS